MIKLEYLKVGDYVGCIWGDGVAIVKKINKKSFTTTTGSTIYELQFQHYFVITEEEARSSVIHKYNHELKVLNEHLKELKEDLNTFNSNDQDYEINTEVIEKAINGILEKIKEKLEDDNRRVGRKRNQNSL